MALFASDGKTANDGGFAAERARMVEEIAAMARQTAASTGRTVFAASVMAAMGQVPRHRFVPAEERAAAYRNHPLPIGSGQTISQPYIVALSTDLVAPKRNHRVLDVGTGSGYQAAVLAEIVNEVYSIEIVEDLAVQADARLRDLGYRNVRVRQGDGSLGWPEAAPFDGIVVAAAATRVPEALVAQLRAGGRMVIPVGEPGRVQELMLIEKMQDGRVNMRAVLSVAFVPMTGDAHNR
jgi:protein-L-isoaspartate(D-aspartate) O-methyltransferase